VLRAQVDLWSAGIGCFAHRPRVADPDEEPDNLELCLVARAEYEEGILNGMGQPPTTASGCSPGPAGQREVQASVVMRMQVRELTTALKPFWGG